MGPYCTPADVQALIRDIEFSDDSNISEAQVLEIIDQESENINSKISKRYVLPIPEDAGGLKVLKRLCIQFVLKRIAPLIAVSADGDSQSNLRDIVSAFSPAKELDALVQGTVELAGVPQKKNGFEIQANFSRPLFTDQADQW